MNKSMKIINEKIGNRFFSMINKISILIFIKFKQKTQVCI